MTVQVDQVVVQRLGGWNLMSLAQWRGIDDDEQQALLGQGAVQFLADGQPVDVAIALRALDPSRASAPAEPVPTVVEWPPVTGMPPAYTVARLVVAGPRWEVLCESVSGTTVPLAELRRPDEFDPYDLERGESIDRLSHDLVAVSLGIAGDATPILGRAALVDFRDQVFRPRLGNRAWRITTGQMRSLLSERPHVRFTSAVAAVGN